MWKTGPITKESQNRHDKESKEWNKKKIQNIWNFLVQPFFKFCTKQTYKEGWKHRVLVANYWNKTKEVNWVNFLLL